MEGWKRGNLEAIEVLGTGARRVERASLEVVVAFGSSGRRWNGEVLGETQLPPLLLLLLLLLPLPLLLLLKLLLLLLLLRLLLLPLPPLPPPSPLLLSAEFWAFEKRMLKMLSPLYGKLDTETV